jgi:hypothetical protein
VSHRLELSRPRSPDVDQELVALEKRTLRVLSSTANLPNNAERSKDSMELIWNQVEVFDELYCQWDEIINDYEKLEESGSNLVDYTANQVESWYTYRNLLAQRIQELCSLEYHDHEEDEENMLSSSHHQQDENIKHGIVNASDEMERDRFSSRHESTFDEHASVVDDEHALLLSRANSNLRGIV